MTETIKITMLADSGAGKTCYMLAMYGGMLTNPHGFSLVAANRDQDIELQALWSNLVQLKGKDRWPQPTLPAQNANPDEAKDTYLYEFLLNYAANPLIKFEWLDYRGGAIVDFSSKNDVQNLNNYLSNSSCLFLCISGEHLQQSVNNNLALAQVNTKANAINNHLVYLHTTINQRRQKYFPVVITISKYDLCYGKRTREKLIADVKLLFPSLFVPGSRWIVMICPITLGKKLATNPDTGIIKPKNCHLPLIFALWTKLREDVISSDKTMQQITKELANFEDMNWLRKWLNNPLIKSKETKLENQKKELEDKYNIMKLLILQLKNAYISIGGKEIELNHNDDYI